MKLFFILISILFLVLPLFLVTPLSWSADTSIAILNISGTVPTVFSVTTRGIPGDLDLTPNVSVSNRTLGLLHFRYNNDVASMVIASSTASGGPEPTSGPAYSFQGSGFRVAIEAGCQSVDPTFNTPFQLSNTGTDMKSALSAALITGIEEDCSLTASWTGTSQALPRAGKYSMMITVTMVSN